MLRIANRYRSITPLLKKVEEVVVVTNTGTSKLFAEYYSYWEQKVFKALNEMVLNGMATIRSFFEEKRQFMVNLG